MVGTEFTAKAVIIGIEVVLLVVFIVLLSSMTSSILKPDKEIVLANTAMLTNAFNEVCRQHRSKTIELDSINFPQPKPSKLMGASDILPRTYINMYGDPNFLLYYEAFPPVEGISWDVYNNELGFRTVAPYGKINEKVEYSGNAAMKYFEKMGIYGQYNDDSFVNTVLTDTMNRLERGKSGASELYAGEKFTVVVPNIMLNKHMMPNPVDGPKVQFMGTEATGFGKWEKEPVMGENNFFAFNSNFALSREEKSYIKYRPCGENTLCLKTREGIYTFPLTECDGKIDYIQLVYDYASVDGVVKNKH